jgi:hypothetical protein
MKFRHLRKGTLQPKIQVLVSEVHFSKSKTKSTRFEVVFFHIVGAYLALLGCGLKISNA